MHNAQITIREKKLGLLIRDARMAERRSIKECADAIGIKPGLFRAYEEGRRAPSLPELETLVYYLKLPLSQFWGNETRSDSAPRAGAQRYFAPDLSSSSNDRRSAQAGTHQCEYVGQAVV